MIGRMGRKLTEVEEENESGDEKPFNKKGGSDEPISP